MSLLDGLISYWKLEEASGNRIDSHGSNDLAPTNTPGNAAGKKDNALSLIAASTQYLSCPVNTLQSGDIDMTFAAWVNLTTKTAEMTILTNWSPYGYGLFYNVGGDRISFQWGATGFQVFADALGSPPIATWLHVIAWREAATDTMAISVNNGTVGSRTDELSGQAGSATFYIGQRGGANRWNGLIDEVGVWDRVLTAGERAALYNGGAGFFYPFVKPSFRVNSLRPRPFAPGIAK